MSMKQRLFNLDSDHLQAAEREPDISDSAWVKTVLPTIARELEKQISGSGEKKGDESLNLAGRAAIYQLLDDILALLFPIAYGKERVEPSQLSYYLAELLNRVAAHLHRHVCEVWRYYCPAGDCTQKARQATRYVISCLPEIRQMLMSDVNAAYAGDPSAKSLDEIILSYPALEAIATYRIAHLLYELQVPIIPRILSERSHGKTGIDIHPGARIGTHFFIDHGTGVVIGETCQIGNNVKMYQGVTLGALSPFDRDGVPLKGKKRHPDIEDNVIIYANATILGGQTVIGHDSIIGGNTWITSSVPPGSVIYNANTPQKRTR